MSDQQDKHLHAGHRSRMRNRYLSHGMDSLETHEVLEMLLYYAIPQKNTNPLAHHLLNTFGSLHGIFSASHADLEQTDGMTPGAALMVSFLHDMLQRSMQERFVNTVIRSPEHAANCFRGMTVFEKQEQFWVFYVDKFLTVKGCCAFEGGTVSSVTLDLADVIKHSAMLRSDTVLFMHNHPEGSALPSRSDVEMTLRAMNLLRNDSIRLLDHIIVSEDGYYSMRENGVFSAIQTI